MEKFITHTGAAVPLRRSNVDTDQIIPAEFLKRISRHGFEDGLFKAWKNDPEFVLNQPEYKNASVLIAGPEFGTGSSREHAVWALQDYGFKCVLSSRFADIFRGNSGKAGLLTAQVEQAVIEQLWSIVEKEPNTQVTVDLNTKTILAGELVAEFQIDDYVRWRLLQGLDDVALTLQKENLISTFEASRPSFLPLTQS